jgi:PD-(D/E)XK nuclease superfamily
MSMPDLSPTRALSLAPLGTQDSKEEDDDVLFWSVTTVLDVLNKPAFIPWAVGVTAEKTVTNLDIVYQRLRTEGVESAVDYIKGLRWATGGLLSDADLGTVAHALFNDYAVTGTRPDVEPELHPRHVDKGAVLADEDIFALRAMLVQFDRFLNQFQPQYEACEVCVYHAGDEQGRSFGFAGQADGFASIGGVPLIFDYKTSRKSYDARGKETHPWPEVGLQLAAYRHATHAAVWRARRFETGRSRRYYLLNPSEKAAALPVPPVDGGVAIHITPDRFGVYPARCGEREFEAFLYCLEVARWQFNEASNVVGNPMIPPVPAPDLGDPFAGLPQ